MFSLKEYLASFSYHMYFDVIIFSVICISVPLLRLKGEGFGLIGVWSGRVIVPMFGLVMMIAHMEFSQSETIILTICGVVSILIVLFDGLIKNKTEIEARVHYIESMISCFVVFISVFYISYHFKSISDPFISGPIMHHYYPFMFYNFATSYGLVPYYDFPIQYGFIPYFISVIFCESNGSFFFIVCLLNSILSVVLFRISTLRIDGNRSALWLFAIVTIIFSTVTCGFPIGGVTWANFPATGGVRFLPVAMVLLLALGPRERNQTVLFSACLLSTVWSFEAGLMSAIIIGGGFVRSWKIRHTFGVIAAFLGGIAVTMIISRLIFGKIDVVSYFDFIGDGTPHSFNYRSASFTAFLILLAFMCLISAKDKLRIWTAICGIIALSIYPLLRGYYQVLMDTTPLYAPIILYLTTKYYNRKYISAIVLVVFPLAVLAVSNFLAAATMPNLGTFRYTKHTATEMDRRVGDIDAQLEASIKQMEDEFGCPGVWVPGRGVPAPSQRFDAYRVTGVAFWSLLSEKRLQVYVSRAREAGVPRINGPYCWIRFPDKSRPRELESLLDDNDLKFHLDAPDGSLIYFGDKVPPPQTYRLTDVRNPEFPCAGENAAFATVTPWRDPSSSVEESGGYAYHFRPAGNSAFENLTDDSAHVLVRGLALSGADDRPLYLWFSVRPAPGQVGSATLISNHAAFKGFTVERHAGDDSNRYDITVGDGGGWRTLGSVDIPPGKWTNVGVRVSSSRIEFHVRERDAKLGSDFESNFIQHTDTPHIGNWRNSGRAFRGEIADIGFCRSRTSFDRVFSTLDERRSDTP